MCVAKPPYFLKWDLQGREGRGCGRRTWGRVSQRFDVDLKRRGHHSREEAEAGDLHSLQEQPEHFLSTHPRESRPGCAGKCGGTSFCHLGVKAWSKEASGAHRAHRGSWQLCS